MFNPFPQPCEVTAGRQQTPENRLWRLSEIGLYRRDSVQSESVRFVPSNGKRCFSGHCESVNDSGGRHTCKSIPKRCPNEAESLLWRPPEVLSVSFSALKSLELRLIELEIQSLRLFSSLTRLYHDLVRHSHILTCRIGRLPPNQS